MDIFKLDNVGSEELHPQKRQTYGERMSFAVGIALVFVGVYVAAAMILLGLGA